MTRERGSEGATGRRGDGAKKRRWEDEERRGSDGATGRWGEEEKMGR